MTTSRRAVIGAAAALAGGCAINAAVIVAAKASENFANCEIKRDPIFALIERYMAAESALKFAEASRFSEMNAEAFNEIVSAHSDAAGDLVACTPRTIAGCVAMLRALQSFSDACEDNGLYCGWCAEISEPGATILGRLANVLECRAVQS